MRQTLTGKRFAVVGQLPSNVPLDEYARRRGAELADPPVRLDFLFVGYCPKKRQEREAGRVERDNPGCVRLETAGIARLLAPTQEEYDEAFLAGPPDGELLRLLVLLARMGGARLVPPPFDFRDKDLRQLEVVWPIDGLDFGGADLRGVTVPGYEHPIRATSFDRADLRAGRVGLADDCSFRGADLTEAFLSFCTRCDFAGATLRKVTRPSEAAGWVYGVDGRVFASHFDACDFSGANFAAAHLTGAVFRSCRFAGADLRDGDLRGSSLIGADLRDADLRGASLSGADLTGASVAGADFTGADLTGANLDGVDLAAAKGVGPTVAATDGPASLALTAAVAGKKFYTEVRATAGPGRYLTCMFWAGVRDGTAFFSGTTNLVEGDGSHAEHHGADSLGGLLRVLARRYPTAELRLDTVTVGEASKTRVAAWTELAVAAWAEAFGIAPANVASSRLESAARTEAERSAFVAELCRRGAEMWRELHYRHRDRFDLRGADFSGGRLASWDVGGGVDLTGANFAGADLRSAYLGSARCDGASFSGANLREASLSLGSAKGADFAGADLARCRFWRSDLRGATFAGANLSAAEFSDVKLQSADFTGANIAGTYWGEGEYDASTVFPAGFVPPAAMVRTDVPRTAVVHPDGMTYDDLVAMLRRTFADSRVEQALLMARVPRYRLFAEVEDGRVLGVVRSKSSRAMLYACYLADGGGHGCVSGSRARCGGLRGGPCKHILSLTIRQVFDGNLAATTPANRVERGRDFKAPPDAQVLHETLERYAAQE